MLRIIAFVSLLFIMPAAVVAQTDEQLQVFNDTWLMYKAAMDTTDVAEQIRTSDAALEAGRLVFDEHDESIPLLMLNYGVALQRGKQRKEAEAVFKTALTLAESIHGKNSIALQSMLVSIGDSYTRFDTRQKHSHYRRALRNRKAHSGKDSEEYAMLALRVGASLYGTDDMRSAGRYVNEAHEWFLKNRGAQDYQTGLASFYAGKFAFSDRKFKASTQHLLSALDAFRDDDEEALTYQLHARAMLVAALESRGDSEAATEHCIAIGRLSGLRAEQDYLPLFRLAPNYPRPTLSKGEEGFVEVEFTVDENGFVRDPAVIRTGPGDRGFENAALDAVGRFRYAPQFEDGEAVAVSGIKTRITFDLE